MKFTTFFKPISILKKKKEPVHSPHYNSEVHGNKGNLGFLWALCVFLGMLFAWQKIAFFFFIMSLEHHWKNKNQHTHSHIYIQMNRNSIEAENVRRALERFFLSSFLIPVEIERQFSWALHRKCSTDFVFIKQTIVYAMDRLLSNGIFFRLLFDGMEKVQRDDRFMIWICANGNGQEFVEKRWFFRQVVKRHMTFTKIPKKWTGDGQTLCAAQWIYLLSRIYFSRFFLQTNIFFPHCMSCTKRQLHKKTNLTFTFY